MRAPDTVDTRTLLARVAAMIAEGDRVDPESRQDAGREARLLAAASLDLSPGELAARMDVPTSPVDAERILAAAARRAGGEPLAYCVGAAAFRHLVLAVDGRVLIPRPETEIVVEQALSLCRSNPGGLAVDVGTGSGAIALSLATEGRFDRVIATDISGDALDVARRNASRLPPDAAPVEFRAGADLAPLRGERARVIVSNPPYISFREAAALPPSVRDWEPATALFASEDGMARYTAIFAGAAGCLEPGGWLVLEVDATRARETGARAEQAGFRDVRIVQDLSGRARGLVARAGEQQT